MLLNAGIIGSGTAAPSPLLNGLLAWYAMGESSGNAIDAHTGGHNLTQSGSVGSAGGRVGNARTFNGNAANFLSSSNAVFNRGDADLYIAFWYFRTSTTLAQHILGRLTFSTPDRSYLIQIDPSARIEAFASGDGVNATGVLHPTATSINTWIFIEFYHDATADQIGVAINGGAFTTATHTTGLFGGIAPFSVGRVNIGGSAVPVFGRVDELALWSRILTAEERGMLWNNGAGISYPD